MNWSRIKNQAISRLITNFPSLAKPFIRSYSPRESDDIPWTPLKKSLARSSVAIVTTAGLHHRSQTPFDMLDKDGDPSYRVIDAREPRESMMITHDYYDHRDADRDLNVVFPIDRLREFTDRRTIGTVAHRHYSFMGHITGRHLRVLVEHTAPDVARAIKGEGVDVVLLTPG